MRTPRLLAVAAVVTLAALAAPAEAKPFTYADAKGELPVNAGLDIVGVTYSTEGTTTVRKARGKTVRKYEPTKLVATMTMAAAPVDEPGVKYRLEATAEGCGTMTHTYSPGAARDVLSLSMFILGCGGAPGATGGDSLLLDPKFAIKGNKLIWTVPLKALPKNVRAGALLYGFKASVDVTDPAIGFLGPDDAGNALLDNAASDADWEIS